MSTRRRIDWQAAKAVFVGDPTRSFAKVARQFGVSEAAVRKHAKAEAWEDAAHGFDAEAEQRAMRAQVKTRDRHFLEAARVRDEAFAITLKRLLDESLEVKLSDLPAIGKYVELLSGEATDRVEVSEVREFIGLLLVRVSSLVEPARRGELVALIREIEGELGSET